MTAAADAVVPARHGPSREDRAAKVFLTFGIFSVLVLVFVGSSAVGFTPLERATGFAPAIVSVVALALALYGVAARRPWALAVLGPILWILIVEGIAASIRAFAHGSLQIPIGSVLAWWALRAPREPAPQPAGEPAARPSGEPRPSVGSFVLVGLFLVGAIGPFVGPGFLEAGGFLNQQADLYATLSLDCGTETGTPPTTVTIRYDWSWLRTEAFASGTDQIVIQWLDEADGGVTGYLLAGTQLAPGVIEANREIGSEPAIVLGVDLAESRRHPTVVELELQRTIPDRPPRGRVEILVRYVHGPVSVDDPQSSGRWDVRDQVECAW